MTNDTRETDATHERRRPSGDASAAKSVPDADSASVAGAPSASGDASAAGEIATKGSTPRGSTPRGSTPRYDEPQLPEGGTIQGAVEALLLVANAPIELAELTELLDGCSWVLVRRALRSLQKGYREAESGFELVEVAKGWRLLTKPLYADVVERLSVIEREQRLTRAQLEVLSIVAYRQPVKRSDIDTVRGADSSGSLRAVIDKGLIRVTGRADQLGRPLLYGTTRTFLERFGLKDLTKLPKPKDV